MGPRCDMPDDASRRGDRVGAIGATDRPMALYTPGREGVTYDRASIWIVVAILAILFAVFFGWVLLIR